MWLTVPPSCALESAKVLPSTAITMLLTMKKSQSPPPASRTYGPTRLLCQVVFGLQSSENSTECIPVPESYTSWTALYSIKFPPPVPYISISPVSSESSLVWLMSFQATWLSLVCVKRLELSKFTLTPYCTTPIAGWEPKSPIASRANLLATILLSAGIPIATPTYLTS